jgi:transcription initiation factor TFIID subunit 7
MDEHDLIVVDDVDESRPVTPIHVYDTEIYADAEVEDDAPEKGDNATYVPRRPMRAAAQQALANNMRRLSDNNGRSGSVEDISTPGERGMRTRPKLQPKLKLKLSEKLASQAPGMSFLGPYDRELDSDEEELAFEEQFILRMPPGEDCERLHKMVSAREVGSDVWFKFKGMFETLYRYPM